MFRSLFERLMNLGVYEPPYDYNFIMNLPEKEYPKYLKKIFKYYIGKNLNLRNPKTIYEKIQWLKLYDNLPIKTRLTDKLLVRDWVKERIGEKYLKNILFVCDKFDEIPFEKLPDSFFIKVNHGCKWHCYIKDKEKFINSPLLFEHIKIKFDNWMKQSFFGYSAFETQYKNIVSKIFIEEALCSESDPNPVEFEIYCFDGEPVIARKIRFEDFQSQSFYNSKLEIMSAPVPVNEQEDILFLPEAFQLSKKLADKFKLVRVDWLVYKGRLYFNEMTFTPLSGLYVLQDKYFEKSLNNHLKIKDR